MKEENKQEKPKTNVVELHPHLPQKIDITADSVLENAKGVFKDVMLLGWDENNKLSIWLSEDLDDPEVNYLLDKVKGVFLS